MAATPTGFTPRWKNAHLTPIYQPWFSLCVVPGWHLPPKKAMTTSFAFGMTTANFSKPMFGPAHPKKWKVSLDFYINIPIFRLIILPNMFLRSGRCWRLQELMSRQTKKYRWLKKLFWVHADYSPVQPVNGHLYFHHIFCSTSILVEQLLNYVMRWRFAWQFFRCILVGAQVQLLILLVLLFNSIRIKLLLLRSLKRHVVLISQCALVPFRFQFFLASSSSYVKPFMLLSSCICLLLFSPCCCLNPFINLQPQALWQLSFRC